MKSRRSEDRRLEFVNRTSRSRTYFASRIARTKIAANSGRVNSGGGASPARSISRTFVPDSIKRSSSVCGQVLNDAIELHRLQ